MKKMSEVPSLLRLYAAMLLKETGFYMLTLRSDNGRAEYVNNENTAWFNECGIRHESSAPYTPEQNGVAERTNRTLLDTTRCMLISSGLPPALWEEAIAYTTYIGNRVLSRTSQVTPFENWNGRKPNLSNIRIFGARAFVRIPGTTKLEARSREGVFVGRCNNQNASRILIPATGKVVVSKDVKVDEQIFYRDMHKVLPPLTSETQIIETPDDATDMNEVHCPINITLLEEKKNSNGRRCNCPERCTS